MRILTLKIVQLGSYNIEFCSLKIGFNSGLFFLQSLTLHFYFLSIIMGVEILLVMLEKIGALLT